jgi:hypothetical protein
MTVSPDASGTFSVLEETGVTPAGLTTTPFVATAQLVRKSFPALVHVAPSSVE